MIGDLEETPLPEAEPPADDPVVGEATVDDDGSPEAEDLEEGT